VNAQGGVQRRPIELIKADDGYEPDRCAENTKKLIDEDPLALFGYIGTPTSVVGAAAGDRRAGPLLRPVHGRHGAAPAVQPLLPSTSAPRTTTRRN
jgi:hypothetical protein